MQGFFLFPSSTDMFIIQETLQMILLTHDVTEHLLNVFHAKKSDHIKLRIAKIKRKNLCRQTDYFHMSCQ